MENTDTSQCMTAEDFQRGSEKLRQEMPALFAAIQRAKASDSYYTRTYGGDWPEDH